MSEYPDIQRGTQFGQVPARQWENVFTDLRRVVGMTAGPGLILDKGLANYRITRTQPTVPSGGAVSAVAQFKLADGADAFPDHLVCRTWDGETEGDIDVLVAKPWLLRQTPFDGTLRGAIRYTYESPVIRTGRRGTRSERQMIIPQYRINDILYASRDIKGGTGVIVDDAPVKWLAWSDGRAWAWII